MPEYLAPGVYIEEIDGIQPIEGVSTSVTGFVGVTERGPLDGNPPVVVTSFAQFQSIFGGYFTPTPPPPPAPAWAIPAGGWPYNLLPHAVAGFFNNGGQLLYIKRVANGVLNAATGVVAYTAASAQVNPGLENNVIAPAIPAITTYLTQNAVVPNPPPAQQQLYLASLRGIQNGTTLNLTQVVNGISSAIAGPLVVQSYAYTSANGGVVTVAGFAQAAILNAATITVTVANGAAFTPGPLPNAPGPTNFALQAADPGAWGNSVDVQISPSSRAQAQVQAINAALTALTVNSAANFYPNAIVEIDTGTQKCYAKVNNVSGVIINLLAAPVQGQPPAPFAVPAIPAGQTYTVRTCEFDIVASFGNVNESFRGLTLDPRTPYFYATTIANLSTLLMAPPAPPNTTVAQALLAVPPGFFGDTVTATPSTMPLAPDGLDVTLSGGNDGHQPLPTDYVGVDNGPGNRTGLQALIDVDQISIIGAPSVVDPYVQGALIEQCETLKYRFAILDPQPVQQNTPNILSNIQTQRLQFDTKYAAIYFPSLSVLDPLSDSPLVVPATGHMAGIYAQTDDSRGVWKAPANVVISGILGLEATVNKADQEILNPEPNNICALRDFRHQGRGLRVYGARCITSLDEWKYINVRRLFIFLEASLDQGTQWAVFEPNDPQLWNRLIQSVSAFLTTVWREGGLMGATAEQAFFVNCGMDTMTQDDLDNGRLIMVVGVAPVYPAEFVIIRIGQWAGGSSVQEL